MASVKHTLCYQLRIHLIGSKPDTFVYRIAPMAR